MNTNTLKNLKRFLLHALISSTILALVSCRNDTVMIDPDFDGVSIEEEESLGTNPEVSDTDDDGYSDGEELSRETDPHDPDDFPWENEVVAFNAQAAFFRPANEEAGRTPNESQNVNVNRSLTSLDPHVEFLVAGDSRLQITFLDAQGALATMADDPVSVVMRNAGVSEPLTFSRTSNVLRSIEPLPELGDYALTVLYEGEPPNNFTDVLPPVSKWLPVDPDHVGAVDSE